MSVVIPRLGTCIVTLALLALAYGIVPAARAADSGDVRTRLHTASVNVGPGCSGVLTEGNDLVVTARHCVTDRPVLEVRFTNGLTRTGYVAATDEVADQAVLLLESPVPVTPLAIAHGDPISGSILYFEGNPHEPRFQEARLDHTGRCPSLPRLPNALFTTIDGVPGDSGAPLVDAGGRVVGLVHGGAQCEIATPANTLIQLIDRVLGPGDLKVSSIARATASPS